MTSTDPVAVEASAYHEAGHAVMAWCLGNPILDKGVAIDGRGSGHCNTQQRVQPGEILQCAATGQRSLLESVIGAAALDADEWQAGVHAERRQRRLGPLSDAELRRFIGMAVRYDPRAHLAVDQLQVLRTVCEAWLARTGRFVGGEGMWGPADDAEVATAYRVIEERVAVMLDDTRVWRAVEAVAAALLARGWLAPDSAHALIASHSPPRP